MNKKIFESLVKANSVDEKNYTIDFIMTIEKKDRHGDIVDVDSIKLDNFMKNPVVLPQHEHNSPAIGKVTETWTEIVDGAKALVGRVKFAVEEYDLAKTYWGLYKGAFMSAVSIGFIPESGESVGDAFVLYGSELLELSMVSIPANQLALAKSAGVDIRPLVRSEHYMKEIRDTLIYAKELMEVIDSEKETVTPEMPAEPVVIDEKAPEQTTDDAETPSETSENTSKSVETPVNEKTYTKPVFSRLKAISLLNKAIREMKN